MFLSDREIHAPLQRFRISYTCSNALSACLHPSKSGLIKRYTFSHACLVTLINRNIHAPPPPPAISHSVRFMIPNALFVTVCLPFGCSSRGVRFISTILATKFFLQFQQGNYENTLTYCAITDIKSRPEGACIVDCTIIFIISLARLLIEIIDRLIIIVMFFSLVA